MKLNKWPLIMMSLVCSVGLLASPTKENEDLKNRLITADSLYTTMIADEQEEKKIMAQQRKEYKKLSTYSNSPEGVQANVRLAILYQNGVGVKQDYESAIGYWLRLTYQTIDHPMRITALEIVGTYYLYGWIKPTQKNLSGVGVAKTYFKMAQDECRNNHEQERNMKKSLAAALQLLEQQTS